MGLPGIVLSDGGMLFTDKSIPSTDLHWTYEKEVVDMKVKNLNKRQRKVLNACFDGWFMSGEYRAIFDDHERHFSADSPVILFKDVDRWYASHEANHGDSHLLVKCVKAA